ncbi:MAG: V-type ATP synthase subunit D [Parachlamydiaceae bacterium]|nr:V-type ATP synthase subunit D [Parachlamydiaceae bacterium]
MSEIKLTKSELRIQQTHLSTLQKYLPTLMLKKAMLQAEIVEARAELLECENNYFQKRKILEADSALISEKDSIDPLTLVKIKEVLKTHENIAGIEVPYFESMSFQQVDYSLFDTPPWLDALAVSMRQLVEASIRIDIASEKKAVLEKEFRNVMIKVNLFEKILIPRAMRNIKKIKVFLNDQQLAAVSQAKVAKGKIIKLKALLKSDGLS